MRSSCWRWPSCRRPASSCAWRRRWSATARPLAEVRGPYNAIRVVGDAVGDTLFYGRGAGAMPTASAVVGDLIDVVTGRAGLPSRLRNLWSEVGPGGPAGPGRARSAAAIISASRSPTGPACWAGWPRSWASKGISIASVIQHDPGDDAPEQSPVPLVIMTHLAVQADLHAALDGDRPARRRPRRRASAWAWKTEIAASHCVAYDAAPLDPIRRMDPASVAFFGVS